MTQPNPSTAQARVLVDELHRQGVSYAVISPGSRSAAIAIALDQHPAIETSVVLDERSAAFRALGRARVDGSPTVMVCTSGTAVANVLPAVVEADLSLVPLIVLSADRPPDLQQIGANQTIDQTRIFGEKVRWFCQVPAADAGSDWNDRLANYAKAEQVLIDNAALVPLVHPVTIAAVSDSLKGAGVEPNSKKYADPCSTRSGVIHSHEPTSAVVPSSVTGKPNWAPR